MQEFKNNENDLFDNPMIEAARKAMTPEHIEDLRLKGESMYKNIDFENGTIEQSIEDAFFILTEEIKSGLHPSFLTENEKSVMKEKLGDKWYENFGYSVEDLKELFTLNL